MEKILLVEDSQSIVDTLCPSLRLNQFEVNHAPSIKEAKKLLLKEQFALAILDINLPDGSGLDLCNEIHDAFPNLPIIVLTARTEEEVAVEGFEKGALDFVRKPFGVNEFVARIRRSLNRHVQTTQQARFGGLAIDLSTRTALFGKTVINLTKREFDLLALLVKRAGEVVTRDEILALLNDEGELLDRTVDSHVSHLRKSLKQAAEGQLQIRAVYGVGYRLEEN